MFLTRVSRPRHKKHWRKSSLLSGPDSARMSSLRFQNTLESFFCALASRPIIQSIIDDITAVTIGRSLLFSSLRAQNACYRFSLYPFCIPDSRIESSPRWHLGMYETLWQKWFDKNFWVKSYVQERYRWNAIYNLLSILLYLSSSCHKDDLLVKNKIHLSE